MKTIKLVVLALLLMVTVGFLLPSVSAMGQSTRPAAPAQWMDGSAPTTCIACFPPPCDCWPDC